MQLYYGNLPLFNMNQAEVTSNTRLVQASTGRPLRYIVDIHVSKAYLVGTTQAQLTQAEAALRTALLQGYADLVLRQDSGAASSLAIVSNASISGVRIIDGPHFEEAEGAEFVTLRTARFTAQAEYIIANTANVVTEFHESISFYGNCGPVNAWRHCVNSGPVLQQVYPKLDDESCPNRSGCWAHCSPNRTGAALSNHLHAPRAFPHHTRKPQAYRAWKWAYRAFRVVELRVRVERHARGTPKHTAILRGDWGMATNRWRGDAVAVAQIENITIGGTPAAGNTVTVTINTKNVTYTVTAADVSASSPVQSVALNFATQLASSTIPEFQEASWTNNGASAVIVATAATAGVPFIYSTSATGGGATISGANVTPSGGPSDASTVLNWTTGAVPTTGDDVLIDGSSDILYGLNSLTTAVYNTLRIKASFGGNIGLLLLNPGGYVEYRTRFFPVGSAVPITIGEGAGQGPTRCNLNCSTTLNLELITSSSRQSTTVPVVNIINPTGGTVSIDAGDLGLAADDDTTSLTGITLNQAVAMWH